VYGDDYVSFEELAERSPEAAEHGAARLFASRADLLLRHGLTERTELSLDLSYERRRTWVEHEDEHHRNETLAGPGDVRLGLKHFLRAGQTGQLAASLGLSFPTGRRNEITAASFLGHEQADELGIAVPVHSHLQLGTGTLDPFVGLEALRVLDRHWLLYGAVDADLPLVGNGDGYRTAPSATLRLGPARHVGGPGRLAWLFGELFVSGRDRFAGDDLLGPGGSLSGRFGVPNTGRLELALTPGLTWGFGRDLTLSVQARIPLYTRIHEDAERRDVQLTEPAGFVLGLSTSF